LRHNRGRLGRNDSLRIQAKLDDVNAGLRWSGRNTSQY
ncbi:MAG: hypothetical protein JWP92_3266, partial [Caulobacter sp.]|nr:hypothetical protein [Caulobacter sp.]